MRRAVGPTASRPCSRRRAIAAATPSARAVIASMACAATPRATDNARRAICRARAESVCRSPASRAAFARAVRRPVAASAPFAAAMARRPALAPTRTQRRPPATRSAAAAWSVIATGPASAGCRPSCSAPTPDARCRARSRLRHRASSTQCWSLRSARSSNEHAEHAARSGRPCLLGEALFDHRVCDAIRRELQARGTLADLEDRLVDRHRALA